VLGFICLALVRIVFEINSTILRPFHQKLNRNGYVSTLYRDDLLKPRAQSLRCCSAVDVIHVTWVELS